MENPNVVSHDEWIEVRTAFLEKEKAFVTHRACYACTTRARAMRLCAATLG